MSDESRDEIYSNTRRMLETIGITQQNSSSASTNVDLGGRRFKKRRIESINESDVLQEYAGTSEEDKEHDLDEVDLYLNMKLAFTTDETLLDWWNKHSLVFPQLSLLAQSLFGIPASSSTAERIFSSAGLLLNKRRQSLSPELIDDILMVRNFRSI